RISEVSYSSDRDGPRPDAPGQRSRRVQRPPWAFVILVIFVAFVTSRGPVSASHDMATNSQVRDYWNTHIHDLEISTHAPGTREFFADLDQYHFEKLHHLPRLVDFDGYRGKRVLEIGCGAGVDLQRFPRGGALVSGVDLPPSAIDLANMNFAQQGLSGEFCEA